LVTNTNTRRASLLGCSKTNRIFNFFNSITKEQKFNREMQNSISSWNKIVKYFVTIHNIQEDWWQDWRIEGRSTHQHKCVDYLGTSSQLLLVTNAMQHALHYTNKTTKTNNRI
jgi:ATP-dependent helicase/DNAse subunit B